MPIGTNATHAANSFPYNSPGFDPRVKPDALNAVVSTTTRRMAHELFKQRAEAPMFPVDGKGSAGLKPS